MSRGRQVPVTPSVVEWALEQSGKSRDDLAAETKTDREVVERWLSGTAQPNLTEARLLAKAVRRPLAFLMWSEPPKRLAPAIAFRAPTGETVRELNPTERRLLRQAQRVQRAVSWLRTELEESPAQLPRYDTESSPTEASDHLRRLLGVSIEEQRSWTSWAKALGNWRTRVESLGILVFSMSLGSEGCRGMMLPDEHAPVIILNASYNHAARIFTLFHELGHALTRSASVCSHSLAAPNSKADKCERWCEEFAAETLLPWEPVRRYLSDKNHNGLVQSLSVGNSVAREFNVSLSAAVLRLIGKNRATWALWKEIPKSVDDKPRGGQPPEEPRTTPVIRLAEFGRPAAELLVRAVESELLDRSQASSILRVDDRGYAGIREKVAADSAE